MCSRLQTTKTSSPRSEAVDEPSSKSQQDHCLPSFLPSSPSVPTSSCRFPVILAPSIRPPTCRVQVGCFRRTYFPNKQRSFCLQYESTGTTVEDLRLIIRHGPLYTTPHCVFVLAYAACCSVHIKTQTTYLLKHRVSIRLALLLAEVISAQGWGRHVCKIFLGCRTLYSRTYTHIRTYSNTLLHTHTHTCIQKNYTHLHTLARRQGSSYARGAAQPLGTSSQAPCGRCKAAATSQGEPRPVYDDAREKKIGGRIRVEYYCLLKT